MPPLLKQVRAHFDNLTDHRRQGVNYSLTDVLMSALAMFSLKDGSLLAFDQQRLDTIRQQNLSHLFGVKQAPCDSQLRAALDPIEPKVLRPAFKQVHQTLQQQGVLADYRFLGKYLISVDGTGQFCSSKVRCSECCIKQHKDGTESYYHQLVAAVIVHPDCPTVLPFCPEAITRRDGDNKNDCEHNASKRLIRALSEDFPRMEKIVLQDALACNGPHIRLLQQYGLGFIITAKPKSNSLLLTQLHCGLEDGRTQEAQWQNERGMTCGYRYINQVSLNREHEDLLVNFIDYWEERPDGTTFLYACVTDIPLHADNVAQVVRAGRSRWKVENETFNTLKNQGYHLEHNYGHGKKHLSSVFGILMMLAFLLDQVVEANCHYFQAARGRYRSKTLYWEVVRGLFRAFVIPDWEHLYGAVIWGHDGDLKVNWHDSG